MQPCLNLMRWHVPHLSNFQTSSKASIFEPTGVNPISINASCIFFAHLQMGDESNFFSFVSNNKPTLWW
jgi:hypothetical protein